MRLLGLLFCSALLCAAQDARDIVRRAIDVDAHNREIAKNYTYVERVEERRLDGANRVTRRESKTFDVTLADLTPYRRLIARNDKPLLPDEEKKEQQRLQQSIEQRQKETPAQRSARLADWDRKRQRFQETVRDVLDAFDFKLAGTDQLAGREVYVIEGTPKPGYRPRTQVGKYLPKLKGRLWIDKQDYFWVKTEAELIDTISYGLFLVRLQKGTHFVVEQTHINDEVWLPRRASVSASARLALFKKFNGEWEITYRDYRKFQTDSHVTAVEPAR